MVIPLLCTNGIPKVYHVAKVYLIAKLYLIAKVYPIVKQIIEVTQSQCEFNFRFGVTLSHFNPVINLGHINVFFTVFDIRFFTQY